MSVPSCTYGTVLSRTGIQHRLDLRGITSRGAPLVVCGRYIREWPARVKPMTGPRVCAQCEKAKP